MGHDINFRGGSVLKNLSASAGRSRARTRIGRNDRSRFAVGILAKRMDELQALAKKSFARSRNGARSEMAAKK